MNLFQIDAEITACVKLESRDDYVNVETGEIIDTAALDGLKMERDRKLRNIGCWILNIDAEEKAVADLVKKYQARQKALKNKRESLKSYVAAFLNGKSWKCDECRYSFRDTESVKIDGDVKNLPAEYLRIAEPEPDKKALREALKEGKEIAGASLETKRSLSVRA